MGTNHISNTERRDIIMTFHFPSWDPQNTMCHNGVRDSLQKRFHFEESLKNIRIQSFPYCRTFQSLSHANKRCDPPKAGCSFIALAWVGFPQHIVSTHCSGNSQETSTLESTGCLGGLFPWLSSFSLTLPIPWTGGNTALVSTRS